MQRIIPLLFMILVAHPLPGLSQEVDVRPTLWQVEDMTVRPTEGTFEVFIKYPSISESSSIAVPVVAWFNGFQSQYGWYKSLLDNVVARGYITVAYQISGMMNVSNELTSRVEPLLQWIVDGGINQALEEAGAIVRANTSAIFTAGHSRGGKVASLSYTEHDEVTNAVLVDPVDSSVFAPISKENPSAVKALQESGKTISVIGAGIKGSCNPTEGNYGKFYDAAASGSWQLVINEAGHGQFADAGSLNVVQDFLCGAGSESREDIAELVAWDMVSWFDPSLAEQFVSGIDLEDGVEFRVKRAILGSVD